MHMKRVLQIPKNFVSEAYATEGTTLKRFTPRAMGRATRKLKRLSHITIVLEEKVK